MNEKITNILYDTLHTLSPWVSEDDNQLPIKADYIIEWETRRIILKWERTPTERQWFDFEYARCKLARERAEFRKVHEDCF